MQIVIQNHSFHYELENLCRVFYPYESIKVLHGEADAAQDKVVVTSFRAQNGGAELGVSVSVDGKHREMQALIPADRDAELCMVSMLYKCLTSLTGYVPGWGLLTGVRPSKLMLKLMNELGEKGAKDYFCDTLFVSGEKTELAQSVARREEKIIALSRKKSFSLYISIPFCPTRCNYCSFVSHSVEKTKKMMEPYVEKLCEEIRLTGRIASELELVLETVYFGGGTPTTLEAHQLERLFSTVEESFDLTPAFEYTVEAGRPDTVTEEKLLTLKAHNIQRISINPQSFNNDVLKNIGRNHTAEDVYNAFDLARSVGFDDINMDLIAGLTGDTCGSFRDTLDRAIRLEPENITVHTLALKRSSRLAAGQEKLTRHETAETMISDAAKKLTDAQYVPYYMYRQSRSLGNLENVGWCKAGKECAYNIFMMEECHTILSCGAGAVTKLKAYGQNDLERIFNFKYPYEYMDRFEELMNRKSRIKQFYDEYNF